MIILDRKIKANFLIRIVEKKTGESVVISIYSDKDTLKSLKDKIKENLK